MLLIIRQLEKMFVIIIKRMKKLTQKSKEKHSVAQKKTFRIIEFVIGASLTVLPIFRQLKKCWTSLQNEWKTLNRKSTEKRTVALTTDFTTLRNLRFYLGASFAVLLILRRLEKSSDINVKQMRNVHLKMHEITQRSTGKTSRYIKFDFGASLLCC